MCTLILGRHVLGPGTLVVAGNRDERADRPSEPPGVLSRVPRVVGGRDAVAGGTWFAVRERRAAVAMLNRRGSAPPSGATLRSRGQLALDIARAEPGYEARSPLRSMVNPADPLARAALHTAWDALDGARYAPFSAVFASPGTCWLVAHRGGPRTPLIRSIPAGWHVLTHAELDDPGEPRAAHVLAGLHDWAPANAEDAAAGLRARLAAHAAAGAPEVCIHDGVMVTVSSFVLMLGPGRATFAHAEGHPCEAAFEDVSPLLGGEGVEVEA